MAQNQNVNRELLSYRISSDRIRTNGIESVELIHQSEIGIHNGLHN